MRFRKRWVCCAFSDISFWVLVPNLSIPIKRFQGQLNWMFGVPLVFKSEFHFLSEDSLEPNSTDISLSLLKRKTRFPLTILTGKILFSVQKIFEIQGWLLLTFSICLHNQLSSFNSIVIQMSEKRDSSNRQWKWMVASFSNFYGKIWVGFCLNIRKRFFLEFSF